MDIPLNHRDLGRLKQAFPEVPLSALVRLIPAEPSDPDALRLDNGWYTLSLPRHGPEQGCRFLQDNRCSIYAFRPIVCQNWPLAMSRSGKLEIAPEHFLLYELACDKTPLENTKALHRCLQQNQQEFAAYRHLVQLWNQRVSQQVLPQTFADFCDFIAPFACLS